MTLTPRGVAFTLAGAVALALGLAFGSGAAGTLGLALLGSVAWALAATAPPRVTAERRLALDATRESVDVEVTLVVSVEGASPGLFVEDAVPPALDVAGANAGAVGAAEARFAYRVKAVVPGRFAVGPLRYRYTDPLGLLARTGTLAETSPLTAYPRVEDVRAALAHARLPRALQGVHRVGQAGSGASFFALREYREGDSVRDVNWRASARRSRSLVVNQRERESHAVTTFLVDGRAAANVGGPRLDARALATRAIATLAAEGQRRRDRARLVHYGAATPTGVAGGSDPEQRALLDALLDHAPAGEAGLAAAVQAVLPALRAKSPVVVVSTLLQDATVGDGVRALKALEQDVLVIAIRPGSLLASTGADAARVAEAEAEHAARVEAARAAGARVLSWDPADSFALAVAKGAGA